MAIVTCKQCKSKIDKNDAIKVKDRVYFCNEGCSDKWDSEHVKKEKVDGDYKELIAYVSELYGNDINYPFITMQIKRFKEEYNMRYTGMLLTLRYYIDVLGLTFNKEYGLGGILPRYYKEAKDVYIKRLEIKKSLEDYKEPEEIIINVKVDKDTKKSYNRFNIEDL